MGSISSPLYLIYLMFQYIRKKSLKIPKSNRNRKSKDRQHNAQKEKGQTTI